MTSNKVTLFFIKGSNPTPAELAAGKSLGTSRFRNSRLAVNDTVEKCDAVAGLVPEKYKGLEGIEVLDVKAEEPSPPKEAAPPPPKVPAPTPAPATKK